MLAQLALRNLLKGEKKGKKKNLTNVKGAREFKSALSLSSGVFTLRFSCSEASSALLAPVSRSRGDGTWYAPPYHAWTASAETIPRPINSVEQSPWQETNPPKEIRPSSLRRYFDSRTRSWVTDNHARRDHFLYYPWQIWWETLSRVVRYNRVESFDGVPGAMCFVRGQIVTVLSEGCNRMWNNLYSIQRVCKSSLTLKESKSA